MPLTSGSSGGTEGINSFGPEPPPLGDDKVPPMNLALKVHVNTRNGTPIDRSISRLRRTGRRSSGASALHLALPVKFKPCLCTDGSGAIEAISARRRSSFRVCVLLSCSLSPCCSSAPWVTTSSGGAELRDFKPSLQQAQSPRVQRSAVC